MYKTILWYSAEKRYTYPKFKATSYAVSRYRWPSKVFIPNQQRTRFLPSSNRWESCRAHANKPFETIGNMNNHRTFSVLSLAPAHSRPIFANKPYKRVVSSSCVATHKALRKYKRLRQFLSPSFPANLLCNMLHYIFTEAQFILLDNTHILLENWIW